MRTKNNNTIITMTVFTFLMLFSVITFAQKISPKIKKKPKLVKAMQSSSEEKGTISYTVISNILQKEETKEVRFNVAVDRAQKVMIEVFNEEGNLIEVLYNDYMLGEKANQFLITAKNWNLEQNHYLRVTTDDYIENHEVVFIPPH
jgi:hypothetical protein